MCGIVSYCGADNFKVDNIKMLMLANMTRGVHSTGMFNDGKITKEAVYAIDFLASNEIKPGKIFIGHDRAATIGNKTDNKNAHPFQFGTIVGVHNGTLKNHWQMVRSKVKGKTIADFNVDSEVLIYLIDQEKENLSVLQDFEGAAALVWHDTDHPNRLYVFRNNERPLFRGYTDEGIYISSIENSLEMIGCKSIQEFKENYLYTLEDGKITSTKRKRRFKVFKKKQHNYPAKYNGNGSKNNGHYSTYDDYDDVEYEEDKGGIDTKSDWVLRIAPKATGMFDEGKYYRILREVSESTWSILNKNGLATDTLKSNFKPKEELNINSYVIAPFGDGTFIKDGEMMYLRGLEYKNKETLAVLEKLEADDHTYTWKKKFIRNASAVEIANYLKNKQSLSEADYEKGEELNGTDEQLAKFANDDENKDATGNRLGEMWIEVGELYENFSSALELTEEILDDAKSLKEDRNVDINNRSTVYKIISDLEDLALGIDIAITDIEKKSFDLYNTNVKK